METTKIELPNLISAAEYIKSFAQLKENFDGYGGCPPSKEVIENALNALQYIPVFVGEDNICPNPHGTITIEFYPKPHVEVSIEIGTYKYGAIAYKNKVPKISIDGTNTLTAIIHLIYKAFQL